MMFYANLVDYYLTYINKLVKTQYVVTEQHKELHKMEQQVKEVGNITYNYKKRRKCEIRT